MIMEPARSLAPTKDAATLFRVEIRADSDPG
jgi:hypothetical protein